MFMRRLNTLKKSNQALAWINLGIVLLFLASVLGCTSEQIKGAAYESIYQRNCMDRFGTPDCDPEHKSYDRYKYERDTSLKN